MVRLMDGKKIVRITLRLPVEVHDGLVRQAERSDRSLHAQIIHSLRSSLAERNALLQQVLDALEERKVMDEQSER